MDISKPVVLRLLFAFLFFLISLAFQSPGETTINVLSESLNKKILIRRVMFDEPFDELKHDQKVEFLATKNNRVLYSFDSWRRSTGAMWRNDGQMVVVNDFTANSGDALYIFAVNGLKIKLIRATDEATIDRIVRKRHPEIKQIGRNTLLGKEWLPDGRLRARIHGECWHIPNGMELLRPTEIFRYDWILNPSRGPLVIEKEIPNPTRF
jgi:hypothetical protein